jgi:UDPglucose--hexose-1-phosphate uridylyltransferase
VSQCRGEAHGNPRDRLSRRGLREPFPGVRAERRGGTQRRSVPGVEQVFAFENRGAEIGVTLHHPHGQIYAYPYVPERIGTHLTAAAEHRARTGRNLFADILDAETAAGTRIIHAGRHWIAYVPFAARVPLEVHLMPLRHVADLSGLQPEERDELAVVCRGLLPAVDELYGTPTPYIFAWYQRPIRQPGREEYRLHLQLTSPRRSADKLKYLAGSEAAMGAYTMAPQRLCAVTKFFGGLEERDQCALPRHRVPGRRAGPRP